MTPKKSPSANLEKKKKVFFNIGIIIAMTAVLVAFNWKQSERMIEDYNGNAIAHYDEDKIPIIINKPPPPPQKPSPELNITEEPIDEDDFELPDPEATLETYIPEWDFSGYDFDPPKEDDTIFNFPQTMPSFHGGEEALAAYLKNNLRFPTLAKENRISGTVFVSFVVEKDGSITNVHVMKGVGGGCDNEAARVVSGMPKWDPGLQGDQPVRVAFRLPIRFLLK